MTQENPNFQLTLEDLKDPKKLAEVEAELAKLYPGVNFTRDPAEALLEGEFRQETEQFIESLVSGDDATATGQ